MEEKEGITFKRELWKGEAKCRGGKQKEVHD
jgi:hypothetical protein